eukprot:352329-Chlamydomonas_euryale.AAC.1
MQQPHVQAPPVKSETFRVSPLLRPPLLAATILGTPLHLDKHHSKAKWKGRTEGARHVTASNHSPRCMLALPLRSWAGGG